MSETSGGDGWWQASDDKWYPPDIRPRPPRSGSRIWWVVGFGAALVLVVGGAVAVFVVVGGDDAETIRVEGTFLLQDTDSAQAGCDGQGGYGDINSITPVVIETATGEIVDRTELGSGNVVPGAFSNTQACEFSFTFEVTEGDDDGQGFVVKVGDRGESLHSFEELMQPGAVALVLN